MAVFKNVASQKLAVFAWDTSADTEKTGDASNITGKISKDGASMATSNDANPTELDATNAPGVYIFDMTQAETNADLLVLFAKSSTANIKIEPVLCYTVAVGLGNRVSVDATAISGATAAADNVEANITNLNATVSSRSAFNSATDTVDVGKISGDSTAANNAESFFDGTGYGIQAASALATVDVGKISGDATAANNAELFFDGTGYGIQAASAVTTVDVGKISGSATAADNVEANIGNLDAAVSSRSTLSSANVNTEVVDVLRVDALAELAQGIPPATPTMSQAVMLLYMAVRNQLTVTSAERAFYNDAGTKVSKKVLSDDGTTYTEAEAVSGA